MIPGFTTKLSEVTVASAATINAKADILKLTGTVQINTINPSYGGGFGGFCILIPVDGPIVLGTSGNINVGITAAINRAVFMVFVRSLGKWIISSGV